jgi:3-hydroxyisobutyrate dehydrogenase-like beta-hydroxyacid dehydrogenase
MKVGFIGIGNIGAPIAGQLLKAGHSLIVHDLRREAAEALVSAGASWSDSVAAIAGECEVVATCLPGPAQIEQVCLGPGGIVSHIKPGGLYIDHTTNSPPLVRRVHEMLFAKGVAMLDAPVSGGMEGAQTSELLVMVGGDPAVFERARPLLDAVPKRVIYTGGIGTGSIAKIMHNSASFTLDLVMAECWTTGVKAGIDATTIVKVFNEAALGQMMSLKVRLPATWLRGDFEPRFSLALARKDLSLALELARATGKPMRLAAICEQEMIESVGRG